MFMNKDLKIFLVCLLILSILVFALIYAARIVPEESSNSKPYGYQGEPVE